MKIAKIAAITGLALSCALATGCKKKSSKDYLDDGWKYRDSVYTKDAKTFMDNSCRIVDANKNPEEFHNLWKGLNDSLNNLKASKAVDAYYATKIGFRTLKR